MRSFQAFDATLVMRRDTTLEIVPRGSFNKKSNKKTRKYIMITPLKVMNQLIKYSEKKRNIPQVMRNISEFENVYMV